MLFKSSSPSSFSGYTTRFYLYTARRNRVTDLLPHGCLQSGVLSLSYISDILFSLARLWSAGRLASLVPRGFSVISTVLLFGEVRPCSYFIAVLVKTPFPYHAAHTPINVPFPLSFLSLASEEIVTWVVGKFRVLCFTVLCLCYFRNDIRADRACLQSTKNPILPRPITERTLLGRLISPFSSFHVSHGMI